MRLDMPGEVAVFHQQRGQHADVVRVGNCISTLYYEVTVSGGNVGIEPRNGSEGELPNLRVLLPNKLGNFKQARLDEVVAVPCAKGFTLGTECTAAALEFEECTVYFLRSWKFDIFPWD